MYKYSNQLLPDVFDNLLSKLADFHEYNTRNASTQHVYVCFRGKTRVQETLSYCGALIWNYILDNVDSNCAIGSYKKRIQRLFLFSNDDLITWYNNTQCVEATMEMKGQSEIANMPKFNNNILENSQTLAKWLETKHDSKWGHYIIGNIDVGLGKFCRNDTLFL